MPNDKPAIVARNAAEAAIHAASANASSTGVKTSEFWVSVLAAAAAVVCGAMIPTPWGALAAVGVSAAAAAYANSRGNVKAAALAAASSVANQASSLPGVAGQLAGAAALSGTAGVFHQTPGGK